MYHLYIFISSTQCILLTPQPNAAHISLRSAHVTLLRHLEKARAGFDLALRSLVTYIITLKIIISVTTG